MDQTQNLIFLHIPKCGGLSVRSAFRSLYAGNPGQCHTINGPIDQRIVEFKNLSWDKRRAIRFLHGHMSYGLHRFLAVPTTYFVMFRDPVTRMISHYHYIRRLGPGHPAYPTFGSMTLEEVAKSDTGITTDNLYVRMLVRDDGMSWLPKFPGDFPPDHLYGTCTAEHLEIVKERLSGPDVFYGLLENPKPGLERITQRMQWPHVPQLGYSNRAHVPPPPTSVEEVEAIREQNRYDVELYEWLRSRYE